MTITACLKLVLTATNLSHYLWELLPIATSAYGVELKGDNLLNTQAIYQSLFTDADRYSNYFVLRTSADNAERIPEILKRVSALSLVVLGKGYVYFEVS